MTEYKRICENKLKWLNENIVNPDHRLAIEVNGRGYKRLVAVHLKRGHSESDLTSGVKTYGDMIEVLRIFDLIYYLEPQNNPENKIFKTVGEFRSFRDKNNFEVWFQYNKSGNWKFRTLQEAVEFAREFKENKPVFYHIAKDDVIKVDL
jgi:hypothetical protein